MAQPFLAVCPCNGNAFNKGKKAPAAKHNPIEFFRNLSLKVRPVPVTMIRYQNLQLCIGSTFC